MPAITHKKAFGIYLWDTFEPPGEDTLLLTEVDTKEEAFNYITDHYNISSQGADRVEVVDRKGNIILKYRTTGTKK